MTCDKIDNHVEDGLSKLISQYQKRKRIEGWITSVLNQVQELEDNAYLICTAFDVDTAVGEQLDFLGKIVGQARGGFDDDTYRLLIKTRILTNKSRGTGPDFINVLLQLNENNVYEERYPATIFALINDPTLTDPSIRSVYKEILFAAKPAGVELWAIDRAVAGDNPFRFSQLYNTSVFNSPRGFNSVHGTVPTGSGKLVSVL